MSDETDKKEEKDETEFKLEKSEEGKQKDAEKPTEKILGKFENQEELIKSYQELQKRLGQNAPLGDLDDEQLTEKVKEIFSDVKKESKLEGTLGDWSTQITKDLGVPAPLVDSIVAKVAADTLTDVQNSRKKEVVEALEGDFELNDNFIDGLKYAGENVDDWKKNINEGEVPLSVVKKFAKLGEFEPEAKKPSQDSEPKMSQTDAINRVLALINTRSYVDQNDPHHKEVRKEVAFLEQKYQI